MLYLDLFGLTKLWNKIKTLLNNKIDKIDGATSDQFLKADGSVDDTEYLPVTGGTIDSDILGPLTIHRKSKSVSSIRFSNSDGILGMLGVSYAGYPCFSKFLNDTGSVEHNKLWHAGNDGAGSGLDADTVDGKHNGELTASILKGTYNFVSDPDNYCITYTAKANNVIPELPHTSNDNSVLTLSRHESTDNYSYCSQLGFSSNGNLYYRLYNPKGTSQPDWKLLAFTNSDVAGIITYKLTDEDLNTLKSDRFKIYCGEYQHTCTNIPSVPNRTAGFNLYVLCTGNNQYVLVYTVWGGKQYTRHFNASKWSDWVQMATVNDTVKSLSIKQLIDEDLDDIKDTNFNVYIGTDDNTCLNKPGSVNRFNLQVFKVSSNRFSLLLIAANGDIYKRNYTGSAWTEWKKILTEDDITGFESRIAALELKLNELLDISN